MKKEKPLILVIFCMFLLLLLIVVPPIFRKYIPKEEIKIGTQTNTIQLLKCDKNFSDNNHKGSSISKYINNKIVTNTIKFTVINNVQNNIQDNNQNNTQSNAQTDNTQTDNVQDNNSQVPDNNLNSSFEEEYQKLIALKDINVETNDNITNIVINNKIYEANKDNEEIEKYFQSIELQKENYESLGYNCQIIEG